MHLEGRKRIVFLLDCVCSSWKPDVCIARCHLSIEHRLVLSPGQGIHLTRYFEISSVCVYLCDYITCRHKAWPTKKEKDTSCAACARFSPVQWESRDLQQSHCLQWDPCRWRSWAVSGSAKSLGPGISMINDIFTVMNDYPFLAIKYIHCFISLPRGEDPTLTGAGN